MSGYLEQPPRSKGLFQRVHIAQAGRRGRFKFRIRLSAPDLQRSTHLLSGKRLLVTNLPEIWHKRSSRSCHRTQRAARLCVLACIFADAALPASYRRGGKSYVGRDLRSTSPDIARLCHAAVADAGLVPVDCGALPTPALSLYAMERAAPAIMVTGSHIPEDRNGLKFYIADGEIDKQDEQDILKFHAELGIERCALICVRGKAVPRGATGKLRCALSGVFPAALP